ncbi:hypothetical protein ACFL1D_04815 [Candidatus Omnitrophota bacterium]
MDIYYYYDYVGDPGTFEKLNTSGAVDVSTLAYDAGTGEYTWPWGPIPNTTDVTSGNSGVIMVKTVDPDTQNTVVGLSNGFMLLGSIQEVTVVSDAEDGIDLVVGKDKTIQWRPNGTFNSGFNIKYRLCGAAQPCTWTQVPGASGIFGDWNDPYRTWEWEGITNLISNNADFRVSDAGNDDLVYSNTEDGATGVAAHIIKGQLDLETPDDFPQLFHIDDDVPISWTKNGSIGNLVIEYSAKGDFTDTLPIHSDYPCGVADAPVVHTYDAGSGADWKAPAKVSENFRVRISTNSAPVGCALEDISTALFKVRPFISAIGSPVPDATWYVGENTRSITWTARSGQKTDGSWPPVKIDYKTSIGSYDLIDPTATGLDCFNGTGSSVGNEFLWPSVPDEKDEGVKIMITFTDYPGEGEEYEMPATFRIRPQIILDASINANTRLIALSDNPGFVKWTYTGSNITTVNVRYDLNEGRGNNGIAGDFDDYLFYIQHEGEDDIPADQGIGGVDWNSIPDINPKVRIRVVDIENANVKKDSPTFKIIGKVDFDDSYMPEDGEKWGVGETKHLEWDVIGSISTVKLTYTSNGSDPSPTWHNLDDGSHADGEYNASDGIAGIDWTIPDQPGIVSPDCLIRIVNIANPTEVNDVSETFKIMPDFSNVLVTYQGSPVSEASIGSTYVITWDSQGAGPGSYVYLYCYTSDFANAVAIPDTEGTGDGNYKILNDLGFVWTMADLDTSLPDDHDWDDVKIRVAWDIDPTVNEDSAPFMISPRFDVTAPESGDPDLVIGQDYDIQWTSTSAYGNYQHADSSMGNYVEISYSTGGGYSKIDNPNGPIVAGGEILPDTYFSNAGAAGALRTFTWNVPEGLTITDSFKIMVADVDNDTQEAEDESLGTVNVMPWFDITQPDGGEIFQIFQQNANPPDYPEDPDILWQSKGQITNAKLELCDGANCQDIAVTGNADGNYTDSEGWEIPDFITDNARIRISDAEAGQGGRPFPPAYYYSDNPFKIKAIVELSKPISTDKWEVGTAGNQIEFTVTGSDKDTGDVRAVRLVAYSADPANDVWFRLPDFPYNHPAVYTQADPFEIAVIDDTYPGYVLGPGSVTTMTYDWTIPEFVGEHVKIGVIDINDADNLARADSDEIEIKTTLQVDSPGVGDESWIVGSDHEIQWSFGGGTALDEVRISYSVDGGNTWLAIDEDASADGREGIDGLNDGKVENDGSYMWTIPDALAISGTGTTVATLLLIEDYTNPYDPDFPTEGVYDICSNPFDIRGDFAFSSPASGPQRWVTNEDQVITWTTTGTINDVNLYYFKAGDDPGNPVSKQPITGGDRYLNNTSPKNFSWTVIDPTDVDPDDAYNTADDLQPGGVLPMGIHIRVEDADDPGVYKNSPELNLDYYSVEWHLLDALSLMPITSGLKIESDSGWVNQSGSLGSTAVYDPNTGAPLDGIIRKVPSSVKNTEQQWHVTWEHDDYGVGPKSYEANQDYLGEGNEFILYLESRIVHVWEAQTSYAYYPQEGAADDNLTFTSTLIRDGSVVIGANSCEILIFEGDTVKASFASPPICSADPAVAQKDGAGNPLSDSMCTAINPAKPYFTGYFYTELSPTDMDPYQVYNAQTTITHKLGGLFRTPFLINLVPTMSMKEVVDKTDEQTELIVGDKTTAEVLAAGGMVGILTDKLDEQTELISGEPPDGMTMEEYKQDIIDSGGMVGKVADALGNFSELSAEAIETLASGAEDAVEAGRALKSTAQRYSWNGNVSPDPALTNDMITLSVQGPDEYEDPVTREVKAPAPLVSIYNWDYTPIIENWPITKVEEGLYVYTFKADSRFTAGKAYTYMVKDHVSGGLITGSGIVESVTLTTIEGLTSQTPLLKSAIDETLDAVTALEIAVGSDNDTNVILSLQSLQDSINELPEQLAQEGTSAVFARKLNEIAERLVGLGGEEGFDLSDLVEEALGDSPAIKAIRSKADAIQGIVQLLQMLFESKFGGMDMPVVSTSLSPGSVRFRVAAANPSRTKVQTTQVKVYLPEEVTLKDIMDLRGLEIEYDAERSLYYAYQNNVVLAPSEVRTFEVEVEDVWIIPREQLEGLKAQALGLLGRFQDTQFLDQATGIINNIELVTEEILESQANESVSRQQHIGIYRQNLEVIAKIKDEMASLEKLLQPAYGPATPEMLEKPRLKLAMPTKTTTWLIILVIMIFVGLFAAVFFFVWQKQVRASHQLLQSAKESAFPGEAEGKSRKGSAEQPPGGQ